MKSMLLLTGTFVVCRIGFCQTPTPTPYPDYKVFPVPIVVEGTKYATSFQIKVRHKEITESMAELCARGPETPGGFACEVLEALYQGDEEAYASLCGGTADQYYGFQRHLYSQATSWDHISIVCQYDADGVTVFETRVENQTKSPPVVYFAIVLAWEGTGYRQDFALAMHYVVEQISTLGGVRNTDPENFGARPYVPHNLEIEVPGILETGGGDFPVYFLIDGSVPSWGSLVFNRRAFAPADPDPNDPLTPVIEYYRETWRLFSLIPITEDFFNSPEMVAFLDRFAGDSDPETFDSRMVMEQTFRGMSASVFEKYKIVKMGFLAIRFIIDADPVSIIVYQTSRRDRFPPRGSYAMIFNEGGGRMKMVNVNQESNIDSLLTEESFWSRFASAVTQ